MKVPATRFATLFFGLCLFAVNCTTTTTGVDPGGSEITNGKIITMTDMPATDIEVSAYPVGYIAGRWSTSRVITTHTDNTGGFTLAIDSGLYNLYIADSASGSGCLVRDVGPKQSLGTIRLDSLGAIEGIIHLDSANAVSVLIVFSTGTPLRIDMLSTEEIFRFDRVPDGSYSLSIAKKPPVGCTPGIDCLPGGTDTPVDIHDISVSSGETVTVDTLLQVSTIGELP